MNIHHLRTRKAELRSSASAILNAPAGADGTLTDEQRTAYDGHVANLDRITGDLDRAERMERDDKEARGVTLAGEPDKGTVEHRVFAGVSTRAEPTGDGWRTPEGDRVPVLTVEQRIGDYAPAGEDAASQIGLSGFMRALVNGPRTDLERRALAEGAVATGGAYLPTPLATEVIDAARVRNVAFQAGARTVPMTAKTLRMAKVISDPVPGWRPENALIPESEPVFGDVSMTAHTLAVRFTASRELLEDAPNMDATLRSVMAAAFARGLDEAVFYGTGENEQPLGIANTPGVQSVSMGTNGATPTGYAPFLDALLALETANEGTVSAIVLAPRTGRTFNGLVDGQGQPLGKPAVIENIPVLTTTGIPVNTTQGTANNTSAAFLGDFSQVLVGIRTQLQITVLQERFAEFGQIGFVGWLRADVQVARPAALAKIVGIKP
ncbi:phage major capsid protein [uncultured Sphingomonas sp.]|uniref:phage major capsid protein n=1 Tax=uncultured Sphingomonas sp. TaxID=158754 RepID=UPI0035C96835